MHPSFPYDQDLHEPGSVAARGLCSHHAKDDLGEHRDGSCGGEAVVSFEDDGGQWESGCTAALEQLVEAGTIEPLGQGA